MPNPHYYSVEEVAERYRVESATVYEWVKKGMLGHVRVGPRLIRISETDLDAFIETRPPNSNPESEKT